MATVVWSDELAAAYDRTTAARSTPAFVAPAVDVLADLAHGGRALEFAIGTGRLALPLQARGVEVHGIELSPGMIRELRAKPGGADLPVVEGDMATARAPADGPFDVVYLVFNTIMNVTTQDEQAAVFANAAAHLRPGGAFVVEVIVPQIRRMPVGEDRRVFDLRADHVGIETLDDPVGQIASSHHWFDVDGRLLHHAAPYRYVWPSELDLMARLAGMERRHRWADWDRTEFTAHSDSHVSVYELPAD